MVATLISQYHIIKHIKECTKKYKYILFNIFKHAFKVIRQVHGLSSIPRTGETELRAGIN